MAMLHLTVMNLKAEEFPDQMSDYELLNKNATPWKLMYMRGIFLK
jgi:hypothetical protein